MDTLKEIFPEGKADELGFVLFSTSGIHGSYCTIEDIEKDLKRYPNGDLLDLTVLIIQPRIVRIYYGNAQVKLSDLPYLKSLRESSWQAVSKIGRHND